MADSSHLKTSFPYENRSIGSLLDRSNLTSIKKIRKEKKFLGEYPVDKIPFLEGISLEAFIGDRKRAGPYNNLSIITPF
jgi:hypothetical protein